MLRFKDKTGDVKFIIQDNETKPTSIVLDETPINKDIEYLEGLLVILKTKAAEEQKES